MRPVRFERTAFGLGNRCSILLSYGRVAIRYLASSAGGCQMRSGGLLKSLGCIVEGRRQVLPFESFQAVPQGLRRFEQ